MVLGILPRVTRPIIDLTKSWQHPGLQKLKHNVVFRNISSAMFFPSQIIKIWLRSSTSSQRFTANRLVSWPAVLKLPFFHYRYLSISPSLLPPQHTHTHTKYMARGTCSSYSSVCARTAGSCQLQQWLKHSTVKSENCRNGEKRERKKGIQTAPQWTTNVSRGCCFPPQMLRITVLSRVKCLRNWLFAVLSSIITAVISHNQNATPAVFHQRRHLCWGP